MPTNQEWAEVHAAALAELAKDKKVAADVLEAIKADVEHFRGTAAETTAADPAPEDTSAPDAPEAAVQAPAETA